MIELHILGTASARPTSTRSVSGSVFSCQEGLVVIDAGEGFQMRYAKQRSRLKREKEPALLRPNRIVAIALTHGHLDHTWGLLPFLQTLSLDGRQQALVVYGPTSPEILDALQADGIGASLPEGTPSAELLNQYRSWFSLGGTTDHLGYPIRWLLGDPQEGRWVEFVDNASNLIWHESMPQPESFKAYRIDSIPTQHSVPSCAWQLSQKERKGAFDRDKATLAGLNQEQRKQLSEGSDVTTENGDVHQASHFRGPTKPATSIVVSGDTAEQSIQPVVPVTVLIHEATFLNEASDKATEHLHSTASGAARTALECKAEHLILTHFSARIRDAQESVSEAQDVIGQSLGLASANDGDRVRIDDDGDVSLLKRTDKGWVQHNLSHH
ncbi:MAG: MBL fold metallo-hydrolase [Candidatus Poseidoniaceae archaeon]